MYGNAWGALRAENHTVMLEIREAARTWLAAGKRVMIATLVEAEGSAPRDPGATFAVSEAGDLAGAISGGCVESDLVEIARDIFAGGPARIAEFGPDDLLDAGLTCGGTIRVVAALLDARMFEEFEAADTSALAIRLSPPYPHLIVTRHSSRGDLGNHDFTRAVEDEARAMLTAHTTAIRSFGPDGEPIGDERVFISTFVDRPSLYAIGAIDFARPLTTVARVLGYRTVVIDPRAAFLSRDRFPDADDLVTAWPDDALARAPIDERTAIVTLAHDPKFDLPTLTFALRSRAGYIGAMGSRSTNEKRLAALRDLGLTDDELARLHAPIGLDLGARTPEETAISIVAEIVAARHGRPGGSLTHGSGPLRGRLSAVAT
jgi:xanthine dehydrogenase accessory factor